VFFPVIESIHAEQRKGERWREQGISGRWAGLEVSGRLSVISDRWSAEKKWDGAISL